MNEEIEKAKACMNQKMDVDGQALFDSEDNYDKVCDIDPMHLRPWVTESRLSISKDTTGRLCKSESDSPDASARFPSVQQNEEPVEVNHAALTRMDGRRLASNEITMIQSAGIGSAITLTVGFLACMIYR